MIFPDKKKAAQIILAKIKPDGSTSEVVGRDEKAIDEDDQALLGIAQDMLRAFKEGSAHDLVAALKAFNAQCEYSEDE